MNKSSISNITALLKKIKPIHYLVVLAIIGIGIFNAVTGIMPQIKQSRYEKGIERSFDCTPRDPALMLIDDCTLIT